MNDVLLIDAEAGDLSVIGFEGLDRIGVTNYKSVARVHEYLNLHCKYWEDGDMTSLCALESRVRGTQITKPKRYRTVILDSLTEIQKYCMYMLLGVTPGSTKLDTEPTSAEYKQWGQSAEMIRFLIRSFRNLPLHCIIVCSETLVEDGGNSKIQLRRPNLPGKLGSEIQGFLDMVGYYSKVPGQDGASTRRLHLEPPAGDKYQAKNRFAKSPPTLFIDDPTMADVLKAYTK